MVTLHSGNIEIVKDLAFFEKEKENTISIGFFRVCILIINYGPFTPCDMLTRPDAEEST